MSEMPKAFDLIVVGGGAAGFYAAVHAAELNPKLQIAILEKTNKVLAKVKISGGGRCNVTHDCLDPVQLSHHYPRGEKFLQNVFKQYSVRQTIDWFRLKGVKLKVEDDGRMFPVTDDSHTIIDCLVGEATKNNVIIKLSEAVISATRVDDSFSIFTSTGVPYKSRKLLITIGGSPKQESYDWIASFGHTVVPPIPSLFTFNAADKKFTDLMGLSVPNAEVRVAGTKFSETGPLLITHWGLSGPAVIKLSAWAASHLHDVNYNFVALVSWPGKFSETEMAQILHDQKRNKGKQRVVSNAMFSLPHRLWLRLCELAEIDEKKIWAELPQRNINKLMEVLIRCPFNIRGKTTFKEEFVTCGGVDLREVDPNTMQSKICQGLYFAGEVLNVDGETGGFNFQNAWSTGYLAAKHISDA